MNLNRLSFQNFEEHFNLIFSEQGLLDPKQAMEDYISESLPSLVRDYPSRTNVESFYKIPYGICEKNKWTKLAYFIDGMKNYYFRNISGISKVDFAIENGDKQWFANRISEVADDIETCLKFFDIPQEDVVAYKIRRNWKKRLSKLKYFLIVFLGLGFVIGGIRLILETDIIDKDSFLIYPLIAIYFTSIIMGFILGVKRLHDVNKSGWFILVPLYNLYLFFSDGDKGINKYGHLKKDNLLI